MICTIYYLFLKKDKPDNFQIYKLTESLLKKALVLKTKVLRVGLEKVIEWIIYLLIGFGIFGLGMGLYHFVNLVFIRGYIW